MSLHVVPVAPVFRPTRFVVGGADDEMGLIRLLILAAIDAGLMAEMVEVEAAPSPRSEAQYASALAPCRGDVWIECAPADGGRDEIDGYGGAALRIDHHQPGDAGYGRPAEESFAASSLGQLIALLLGSGVSPATLGLVPLDIGPFGADPGWQSFPQEWGASWGWIENGVAWACPPEWVAVGAADHDPASFASGRVPGWTAAAARAWLIARSVAGGRGVTEGQVVEALAMIEAAPTLPGFPAVYDLRGIPELCPAIRGADGAPVPGTGGRLGSAAFVAVLALPGRAALNWGAQGIRPAGRHLGLIGATGPDFRDVLTAAKAVEAFGAPGKACGGYVPV